MTTQNVNDMTLSQVAKLLDEKGLFVDAHKVHNTDKWRARLLTREDSHTVVSEGEGKNSITAMIRALEDL